jgi:hypothetical protein
MQQPDPAWPSRWASAKAAARRPARPANGFATPPARPAHNQKKSARSSSRALFLLKASLAVFEVARPRANSARVGGRTSAQTTPNDNPLPRVGFLLASDSMLER